MVTLGSHVAVAADQLSTDLADEAVVLSLRNGTYYGLDPVGARIWSLIQTPRRVEAIKATLLDEYEVTPEQCQHDLIALLQQLADEGLVEVDDAAAA